MKSGKRVASYTGRILVLVVIAGVLLATLQLVEVWLLPTWSADVAVAQLESSDRAAETLRLLEWVRAELPLAIVAVLGFTGAILFTPVIARWLGDWRRTTRHES